MMSINLCMTKTLSLNPETIKDLKELKEVANLSESKLVRIFVKYFYENKTEFFAVIKNSKKTREKK